MVPCFHKPQPHQERRRPRSTYEYHSDPTYFSVLMPGLRNFTARSPRDLTALLSCARYRKLLQYIPLPPPPASASLWLYGVIFSSDRGAQGEFPRTDAYVEFFLKKIRVVLISRRIQHCEGVSSLSLSSSTSNNPYSVHRRPKFPLFNVNTVYADIRLESKFPRTASATIHDSGSPNQIFLHCVPALKLFLLA